MQASRGRHGVKQAVRQERDRTLAFFYGRVSLDRELHVGEEGLAVDRQEVEVREHAARLGLTIVGSFTDNSVSALRGKYRKGFEAMRAAVLDRTEVGTILAWHPDRLTRYPRELEDLIELLDDNGLQVVTKQAGTYDLATAAGRMLARQMGAVARMESELKAERMTAKNAQQARAGHRHAGPRPFGYLTSTVCEVIPHEADLIRSGYEAVLRGETLKSIARTWNAALVEAPRCGAIERVERLAGKFHASSVGNVLRNPVYVGAVEWDGELHEGPDGPRWEPIVDRVTFERVGVILDDPARKVRRASQPYELSGLVRVGVLHDERPMSGAARDGERCYWSAVCRARAADLEAVVRDQLFELLAKVNVAERIAAAATTADERSSLEAERDGVKARRAKLKAQLDEGLWEPADIDDDLRKLRAEQTRIEAQLAAAATDDRTVNQRAMAMLTGEDVDVRVWTAMTPEGRNAFARQAIEAVWVKPARTRGPKSGVRDNPERVLVQLRGEAKPEAWLKA